MCAVAFSHGRIISVLMLLIKNRKMEQLKAHSVVFCLHDPRKEYGCVFVLLEHTVKSFISTHKLMCVLPFPYP